MNVAYLKEDKVVLIVEASSIEELLPLDKKYQNLVDLSFFTPEPKVGWLFIDNQFIDPSDYSSPGNVIPTKITKLALLNRFTMSELIAYEAGLAASSALKILDKKLFAATYIDLSRQDTIDGIGYLVTAGILTSERCSEILNAQPTTIELYQG